MVWSTLKLALPGILVYNISLLVSSCFVLVSSLALALAFLLEKGKGDYESKLKYK